MKSLLFAVLLMPTLGFSATLSGSITDSTASVALSDVGTVDWKHWPRGTTKAGLISNISAVGYPETYWTAPRIVSAYNGTVDRTGTRVTGAPGSLQFTVPAAAAERTLLYYIGGWNSTGRVTVSLPGAASYTADFQHAKAYSKVLTIRFSGDAGSVLTVRHQQVAGAGDIFAQAAALQGASAVAPPVQQPAPSPTAPPANAGTAVLYWSPPTQNTSGQPLNDLTGFKVFWYPENGAPSASSSFTINNLRATSYTVTGLPRGTYYFVMTSLTASGDESDYSNRVSKWIN